MVRVWLHQGLGGTESIQDHSKWNPRRIIWGLNSKSVANLGPELGFSNAQSQASQTGLCEGKNRGAGWALRMWCHRQEKVKAKVKVTQLCPTLCDPMDCSPPSSSVHGILQQEYWSGSPFPSPRDLPDSGIEPSSPTWQANSLPTEPPRSANAGGSY